MIWGRQATVPEATKCQLPLRFLKFEKTKKNTNFPKNIVELNVEDTKSYNKLLENEVTKILNVFPAKKINKIIFTSSSSVNFLDKISLNQSKYTNREIYSLTKSCLSR